MDTLHEEIGYVVERKDMRLIDADTLLKKINGEENQRADKLMREWYAAMVSEQPTAYDVDKVMKQLEGLEKRNNEKDLCRFTEGYDCAIDEAIEIVKSGGID